MSSLGDAVEMALWRECRCEACIRGRRLAYVAAEWPSLVSLTERIAAEAIHDTEEMIEEAFGEESRGLDA